MEGIKDLWEGLQKARKPIVIYGMGDGCDKILKICEKKGIPIRGIFASDDHVRKKTVHGFPLKSLQEIKAEWGEVIALLAFGAFRKELMDHILFVAKETELYAPEVPLFGGGLFDRAYFCENEEKIETVCSFLSDEASRRVFQNLLDFKLFGTVDSLIEIQSEREEDLKTLVPFRPGDCYLDLGAYDGDTVFCMASGKKKVINLALLYVAVTEAVSKAIENAVLSSKEKNGK